MNLFKLTTLAGLAAIVLCAASPMLWADTNDVTWTTLGENENDSMPIGNGDLAANVWTEAGGDVVILLAKSDAWTETGKLVKLGRVRVKIAPNPFAANQNFSQTLHVNTSTIELSSGEDHLRIWADANHPVLHVEGQLAQPATVQADAEFWRKTQTIDDNYSSTADPKVLSGDVQPKNAPDFIFPTANNTVAWCHYNLESFIPFVLSREHLEASIGKHTDPLLRRCFGVALTGRQFGSDGDRRIKTESAIQDISLEITTLTQKDCPSPKAWRTAVESLIADSAKTDLSTLRKAHEAWWQSFWDRSYVRVSGDESAAAVSQSYVMQRYMMACSSRGEIPPKFNGGLFTVGRDREKVTAQPATTTNPSTQAAKQSRNDHDPDYRGWGDCYWNQNNRLLFYPLIATGDYDLVEPWFNMYVNALPLASDRTRTYYHHSGAHFSETQYFFGLPNLGDFWKNSKSNPTFEIESHWQRYHYQGSLEIIVQMLDVYDQNQDSEFALKKLVPFADAIVTFYDQHYPRNSAGKLTILPAQSLETYQLVAINPTPEIAGLTYILPRLLALPNKITTTELRDTWSRLLKELPPIPIGKTAKGKLPPMGVGDPDGRPTILPAEQYGKPGNSENPELYVAFPYRLYGVGKPDLKLAQDTYAARRSPQNTCWGQDGNQSAMLGLTDEAQKCAIAYFSNYGDQRYKWFWKPAHDYIPDLDNGGDGMNTLQLMLMQCDGQRIHLIPAWPKNWTADFKLHAPLNTTVEAHVEGGKLSNLKVTPEARAKDVVIVPEQKW